VSDALVKEVEDLEGKAIAGRRVREFIDDPDVKAALQRARDRFYDDFVAAKTDDERRNAQAGRIALDAIANELAVTVQRGATADKRLEVVKPKPKK
jgi:hypothetical protein